MAINLDYFKNRLGEEKSRLEAELTKVGKRNPQVPGDWEPTAAEMDTRPSEQSELADKFEELENRSAIEIHLEEKLNEVNAALERIKNGTYGVCTVCGEKIDEKRLEANPSAATCVKHSQK
jgi:RNA polymerase-binding transcription factor DksA